MRVGSAQILRDAPATDPEVVRRDLREGSPYAVDLRWPQAIGPVATYRIKKDGEVLATFHVKAADDVLSWRGEIRGKHRWSVEAGDGRDHWTQPLTAESLPVDGPETAQGRLLSVMVGGDASAVDGFGGGGMGLRGLGESSGDRTGIGIGSGIGGGLGAKAPKRVKVKLPPPTVTGGLSPDLVARMMRRARSMVEYCVRGKLKPTAVAHEATLRFDVKADGAVANMAVEMAGDDTDAFKRCVIEKVGRAIRKMPPPTDGAAAVSQQITLD